MKKFVIALSFFVLGSAFAQQIPITKSSDNEIWVAHASTFKIFRDGFSMMVSKISAPNSGKPEFRMFVGVTKEDCNKGYGVLMARGNETEQWVKNSNFVVEGASTVGDEIAAVLCGAGMKVIQEGKSQKKSA